ncbi:hypothetical protein MBLNU13_g03570t1 [Cladosporium sp. NU13]
MAGFIPDSLPPVTILPRSSMSPYQSLSLRSASSPISTISPTSVLPRPRSRASGSISSSPHPRETPTGPDKARTSSVEADSADTKRHIEYELPDDKSTPSPTTTTSPSPAPTRTLGYKQKSNFNIFGRSTSARDTASKPKKHKKLVKKSISQPTFAILNPRKVRDDKALGVEAAQLGLQLEEAVAAINRGSANVALARAPSAVAAPVPNRPAVREKEPAQASISTEQRETKRWSNAPILPELDFGSSSSESDHLFDPKTHNQRPKATISVSILVDRRTNFNNPHGTSNSPSKLTYRCDIHAEDGASHSSVEKECQNLVKSAGGHLLNSYFCPGGFLYTLPLGTPEPITASELPLLEAKIGVEAWTAFSEPQFNGLRLHPPEGRLGRDRPARSRTNEMSGGLKAREKNVLRLVDAWVESQNGAAKQGPSDEYIGTKVHHDAVQDSTAHTAAELDDSTVTCSPPRKVTLVKSLELLRRVSGATRTAEDNSTSSKTAQSPGTKSENRFTVIMDTSESDSGSGAEEWESVVSEFESQT